MKMALWAGMVLAGLVLGAGAGHIYYKSKLAQLRGAQHVSAELLPVQVAASAMTRLGYSNFSYLVIGENSGIASGGWVRSNSVTLGVNVGGLK